MHPKVSIFVSACGLAVLLLLSATAASAQISGNVAITTDYIFRGVSQTGEEPAIQGGFDYEHDSGFSIGIWGSNVDFGTDANLELDLYASYSKELASGFSWQVGFIHYDYPAESTLNFDELFVGIGYKFVSVKYSVTDDLAGTNAGATYLEAALDWELANGIGLGVHGATSSFDFGTGLEDYVDYKVYLSTDAVGLDFELAFFDTDTDQFGDAGEGRIVLTLSKSL